MDLIELVINELEEDSGIDAISIVSNPAIEEDFIALSKQDKIALKTISDEKRLLMGAALVPDKPILRFNEQTKEEYNIFFSKETVRRASELVMKRGKQGRSTLEHAVPLKGIYIAESWIVEDKKNDKSALYGLSVPIGTWMVSLKVENDDVWNDYVKTGEVKGFSIEGYFADKVEMSSNVRDVTELELINLIIDVLKLAHNEG